MSSFKGRGCRHTWPIHIISTKEKIKNKRFSIYFYSFICQQEFIGVANKKRNKKVLHGPTNHNKFAICDLGVVIWWLVRDLRFVY